MMSKFNVKPVAIMTIYEISIVCSLAIKIKMYPKNYYKKIAVLIKVTKKKKKKIVVIKRWLL